MSTKLSPKKTEELKQSIINHRSAIKRAEEFITIEEHPGWQPFMDDVDNELQKVEIELNNFEALDQDKRTIRLQKQKDLKWLRHVVERVKANLPKLYDGLSLCEAEIAEREKRSGSPIIA